ncbi:MAG: metal-dependent hydrolase [Ardenticatenaceae bacterium]|nr:metal-dependent hydrolase [Ardenticatenaceae bacterium]
MGGKRHGTGRDSWIGWRGGATLDAGAEVAAAGHRVGSLLPDADNLAVAVATVTGGSTEGLHRTFTHSLFFVLALMSVFWLVGMVVKRPSIGNFGFGLGIGVLMHILLDLLIWFDGVAILWPLPSWVNFWEEVTPPEWFSNLLMPLEMLFFAAYFYWLSQTARRQGTNLERVKGVRVWTAVNRKTRARGCAQQMVRRLRPQRAALLHVRLHGAHLPR